jgi:hypothetical protein
MEISSSNRGLPALRPDLEDLPKKPDCWASPAGAQS